MNKTFRFTEEQYEEYIAINDGMDSLYSLGLEPEQITEPIEDVHQRIFEAHRDGHNTVAFEMKD